MMEVQAPRGFDWANEAYAALNDPDYKHARGTWPYSAAESSQHAAFAVPPAMLSHASLERYGQITPPEEHSPVDLDNREGSIPVEQLRNETLWPEHQLDDLKHASSSPEDLPSPKRRRASKQALSNHMHDHPAPPSSLGDANPQPPKRKRGRPKSQPQMVEAFTADGYPIQISSSRQSHLEKNRVAAHKCRQRKKEYINGLEGRAREFSSKNKILKENVAMLREEVLGLKNEVLRHAGCGFWAVDEYLARCAGDLLGMEAPPLQARHNSYQSSSLASMEHQHQSERADSVGSNDSDDFEGLELLKDFDDADMDELEKMA